MAEVGIAALLLSLDPRWSAWKLLVQTFSVGTALLLVGAARAWDDFDTGNVVTYLYIGCLVACDIALLLLYRKMTSEDQSALHVVDRQAPPDERESDQERDVADVRPALEAEGRVPD